MSTPNAEMDLDEILSDTDWCANFDELAESDVDFDALTHSVDLALSEDEFHEYTANHFDIHKQLDYTTFAAPRNNGAGSSSMVQTNPARDGFPQERENIPHCGGSYPERGPDAKTSTWKLSKPTEKDCLATSVEIEGVSYTYNLMPTSKSRKPNRKSVPGSKKDKKYWDRRSKNNEAAKRSRDLRRQKEMLVASKAADLEMQNEELKAEVKFLREQDRILTKKQ